jgi:hypothetical protein
MTHKNTKQQLPIVFKTFIKPPFEKLKALNKLFRLNSAFVVVTLQQAVPAEEIEHFGEPT